MKVYTGNTISTLGSKSVTPSHLSVNRIAFPKLTRKPSLDVHRREVIVSHEQETYGVKNKVHAGMKNKPLVPYKPDCDRSRLISNESAMFRGKKSSVEIGSMIVYKPQKVFKTSYQNLLDALNIKKTNNPGIFAERTRWFKSRCMEL